MTEASVDYKKVEITTTTIRLPRWMHAEAVRGAAQEQLMRGTSFSLNSWILEAIREKIERGQSLR
jgi:predicted HicB family RNase H-like nuclease